MSDDVHDLTTNPVHIGLGATTVVQPDFTGEMDWYTAYGDRHGDDGAEGRLVSLHRFSEPWDTWEMHPDGSELVLCVDGSITLHQDIDGSVQTVTLDRGQYVINPPGAWHTADVAAPATALFITAGLGTEMKPR